MKRFTDILICLLCAPLVVPLICFLGLLIRLESGGGAFFVHTRLGRARRPFKILKLRTMVSDLQHNQSQVTAADDSRITPLGGVLRRYGLDELPQLWNVLVGEMSIVGPRPEVPRYVAEYLPEWEAVFSVRPGITDAASIVFRGEEQLLAEAKEPEQAYKRIIPIKLTDIAAALGLVQLGHADQHQRDRRRVAERYLSALQGCSQIKLPRELADRKSAWHLFPIRLRRGAWKIERSQFIEELRQRGIGCSVHWKPLHLHTFYRRKYGYESGLFPVAEEVWPRLASLPIFPAMTDHEITEVLDALHDLLRRFGR